MLLINTILKTRVALQKLGLKIAAACYQGAVQLHLVRCLIKLEA